MPSVLVLHAWWGRTPWFEELGQRFADEGFNVAVPDLFGDDRTAASVEDAEALSDAVPAADRLLRAELARETLPDPVGVVGFSLGAGTALALIARDPTLKAAVLYYGTWLLPAGRRADAAVLGHFAADDPYEEPADVRRCEERLRELGARPTFHVYDGTRHWFAEPDRPEHDLAAADLAWARTLSFLRAELAAAEAPGPS